MHVNRSAHRLSRRAMLALTAGSALAWRRDMGRARERPTPIASGICGVEPGVELLLDWRRGQPVLSLGEQTPPVTWREVTNPGIALALLAPPDWTAFAWWADVISQEGEPNWVDRQPRLPQLSLLRLVSPEQDAAWEFAVGNIQGEPLTPGQAATVAKQGLLGKDPRLTAVCSYEDPANPTSPNWFMVDRFGEALLLSNGVAIPLASTYLPATTVTYQNMFGPRDRFEALMRSIFIPLQFQLLGSGGPGGEGGDGGDGDGGNPDEGGGDDPGDAEPDANNT